MIEPTAHLQWPPLPLPPQFTTVEDAIKYLEQEGLLLQLVPGMDEHIILSLEALSNLDLYRHPFRSQGRKNNIYLANAHLSLVAYPPIYARVFYYCTILYHATGGHLAESLSALGDEGLSLESSSDGELQQFVRKVEKRWAAAG